MLVLTDILEQDHHRVLGLFLEFDDTQDWDTAHRSCDELERHFRVTSDFVLPLLEDLASDVLDKAAAHVGEASELIAAIRSCTNPVVFPLLVTRLHHLVRVHVEEEQSKIWPALRVSLSSEQLDGVAAAVSEARREMRPVRRSVDVDASFPARIRPQATKSRR